MAVGKEVISAYSGPADVNSFDLITHVPSSTTIKPHFSDERNELESLYETVRKIRNNKTSSLTLNTIFEKLKTNHPNDWLLSVEIAELCKDSNNETLLELVITHLNNLKVKRPEVAKLITNGLMLILEAEKV
jgi:phenylalanine-4-hydroxylase